MELCVYRRWVADHEAGHAVARLVLDRRVGRRASPIRKVRVIPEGKPWPMSHTGRDGKERRDVDGVVERGDRCMSANMLRPCLKLSL
jgi:hypothetical protein